MVLGVDSGDAIDAVGCELEGGCLGDKLNSQVLILDYHEAATVGGRHRRIGDLLPRRLDKIRQLCVGRQRFRKKNWATAASGWQLEDLQQRSSTFPQLHTRTRIGPV